MFMVVYFSGCGCAFTHEPYNPIYFNNGSDANLVSDYADPHNNVQSTLYSVQVAGAFVKMMVNDSRGVQESSIGRLHREQRDAAIN